MRMVHIKSKATSLPVAKQVEIVLYYLQATNVTRLQIQRQLNGIIRFPALQISSGFLVGLHGVISIVIKGVFGCLGLTMLCYTALYCAKLWGDKLCTAGGV